jgi:hypothetical protein
MTDNVAGERYPVLPFGEFGHTWRLFARPITGRVPALFADLSRSEPTQGYRGIMVAARSQGGSPSDYRGFGIEPAPQLGELLLPAAQ